VAADVVHVAGVERGAVAGGQLEPVDDQLVVRGERGGQHVHPPASTGGKAVMCAIVLTALVRAYLLFRLLRAERSPAN